MSIPTLLDALAGQGVELWVEGDRLRFRAPRGTLSAEQRATLGQRRDAVVAELRARASTVTRYAPLSFTQRSLWFVHQEHPESAAYNVGFAARIVSQVDRGALSTALQALVDRHGVLRTTYEVVDEAPAQRVAGGGSLRLDWHDLPGVGETELRTRVESDYARPFDLPRGPVIRASMFSRGPEDHVFLLTVHHIAADGWSLFLLVEELRALYAEAMGGAPASLESARLSYAEYATREAELLAGPEGERLERYWLAKLAPPRSYIELAGDRPRPAQKSVRGATLEFRLEPGLAKGIRQLARDEGATVFAVLLAAFNALLYRYTGTEDVVVGTPTFGRTRPEYARIVGHFVNPVPLRAGVRASESFPQLLGRVRKTVLEALDVQEYPFALMVEKLRPQRDQDRNPFFETLFIVQRFDQFRELEDLLAADRPDATVDFGGMRLQPYPLKQQEGQFDLTLQVVDAPTTFFGAFKYSVDVFERSTIERMEGHLRTLLWGIVAEPTAQISALPLLTEGEREALAGWNDTTRPYPLDRCLHELIEDQAARTPEAVAVQAEAGQLTYGELDARANQLARHLLRLGVGPEVLVGVVMERSLEMVVALLGILKAGGAYVPLDPTYPRERLSFMMDDARVPVLLTQQHLLAELPASRARVLALDSGWPEVAGESAQRLEPVGTSENLAYMIYTSGSTGRPKGAMNTHRGIVNRLLWMQEAYGLGADDVVLQKTPFSFDVSVWEFFWPLLAGARLVMARPEGHKDPSYLVRTIVDEGVTTIHFVPPMLQAFLEEPGLERCTSLRRVVCSGEALPAELCSRFFEQLSCELHNLYGPTEAAVDVTYFHCRPDDPRPSIPIGRPVANTHVYVLDPGLEPVPVGVAGELHLGGVQVGRGYLGRPDLTAERFIPDPFGGEASGRLYKTGDLARLLPDGNVEYLGRLDHQVKIRGFRIELGEIEAAIVRHPAIREAVVLAREDRPGDRRLIAYVTAPGAAPRLEDELRSRMGAELPDYMVPSAIVLLDALPLSPNGKVDRKALPAPDDGARPPGHEYVAPGTTMEKRVSEMWASVIGKTQIGVDDNFFDLGGNSLLLLQVVARARHSGVEITPLDMFRFPTVRALAARLADGAGSAPDYQRVRDRAQQQRAAMARERRIPRRD